MGLRICECGVCCQAYDRYVYIKTQNNQDQGHHGTRRRCRNSSASHRHGFHGKHYRNGLVVNAGRRLNNSKEKYSPLAGALRCKVYYSMMLSPTAGIFSPGVRDVMRGIPVPNVQHSPALGPPGTGLQLTTEIDAGQALGLDCSISPLNATNRSCSFADGLQGPAAACEHRRAEGFIQPLLDIEAPHRFHRLADERGR